LTPSIRVYKTFCIIKARDKAGVLLLSLKGALISLLIIFSAGLAAAEEWREEKITDFGEEGIDLGFDATYYGEGETSGMMIGSPEGLETYGATTGTSGLSEAYYSMDAPSSGGGNVQQYSITGHEPSTVRFGDQSVSYSTYHSAYGGTNSLWILGTWSWTQYASCPLWAYLQLLAYSPSGGSAELYEIYPNGNVDKDATYFWPGYTRINFQADAVGRHILLFVVNNQPSNAVVIDVSSGGWPPGPGPSPVPSYARVTVRSSWLSGYTVSVDDIRSYNDVSDGSLDGVVSFTVSGDQYHTIKITSPGYLRSYYRLFRSGYAYTLTM
jgi:hypothetical protein